ncbi:hypothetical protein N473_08495 [Pseudoalteromonas luteoviolacea CPMOR-1]|uniref:Uncharacterized protein n=1 Tax=Pseudoalteromonas luteoviolacea CPMOR-1 TaxID=1365248 RepID=A0A167MHA5_9GAMM|nr:hypothetical protein [Pseudoalteromonas luteoviolacea]KZN66419.1 hypothetical protein N473_08495 [Pseudoalteromonas luteoviolacea CPMOR-1]
MLEMKYGDLFQIEEVDYSKYRTCRGAANRAEFESVIETIRDPNSSVDELDDAINDGLWDLFSHQYTLYSSTPLALYLILSRTTKAERIKRVELSEFIKLCKSRGNEGIFLTEQELLANKRGELPIFSIADILRKYT